MLGGWEEEEEEEQEEVEEDQAKYIYIYIYIYIAGCWEAGRRTKLNLVDFYLDFN